MYLPTSMTFCLVALDFLSAWLASQVFWNKNPNGCIKEPNITKVRHKEMILNRIFFSISIVSFAFQLKPIKNVTLYQHLCEEIESKNRKSIKRNTSMQIKIDKFENCLNCNGKKYFHQSVWAINHSGTVHSICCCVAKQEKL